MSNYCWVITEDWISTKKELRKRSDHGIYVSGPCDHTTPQLIEAIAKGKPFRMYDDDSEHYYDGRIIGLDNGGVTGFEPLVDYGMPNAGCTQIFYFNRKVRRWEQL